MNKYSELNKRARQIDSLVDGKYIGNRIQTDLLSLENKLREEEIKEIESGYITYNQVLGGFIPPQEYLMYLKSFDQYPSKDTIRQLCDKYCLMIANDMMSFQVHGADNKMISQVGRSIKRTKIVEMDNIMVVDSYGLVHTWDLSVGDVYLAPYLEYDEMEED